jgi:hypothetical protein
MAAYNKFNCFVEDIAEKIHNLGADTLKVALSNTLPVATNTVLANITQIGPGNGYATGGNTATLSTSAQIAGTYKLVLADVTFTASGGNMNAFQYAILYNDTPTSPADPLIGWYDYGTAIIITSGNSFTLDLDQTNGVFTFA